MGKSQRTKGATYEREVAQVFSEALGRDFKRNIGQARDGGNDLDVGPLVVECKRRKTLGTVYGWLDQAFKAAVEKQAGHTEPRTPIVVARQDQGTSIVIMDLEDFLELAGPELQYHIRREELRELEG